MLDTLGHACGRAHEGGRDHVQFPWDELVFRDQRDWPRSPRLRVVDLFCSIGGLTCGVGAAASRAGLGITVQLAVDIDAKALELYGHNFGPAAKHLGSISELVAFQAARDQGVWRFYEPPSAKGRLADLVGTIDLVIGGPPCQGHSNFNNATRRDDPRNSLYLTAISLAIAVQASAVIFENVPDVTRSDLSVIRAAVDLFESAGYSCDNGVLAAHELGWSQTRRRHFFVASKKGVRKLTDVAEELKARPESSSSFLNRIPRRSGSSLLNSLPEYSEETLRRFRFLKENPDVFDLPLAERPDCHKDGTSYKSVYGRMRPEEPVPTLTSGFLTPGRGRFVHPTELRTLTPSEAAYVQAFPSWYSFDESIPFNRNDLTKWIGDAVPLPLGYAAALSVLPGLLES